MSSDPPAIPALFTDGETAQVHPVTVTLDQDRLAITGETLRIFWRVKRLHRLPDQPDGAAVLCERDGEARLIIAAEQLAVLTALLPALMDAGRVRRGTWMLGGALTALAAGLAGFMFYGLPLVSTPLARAVPLDVETRLGERSNQFVAWFTDECETSEEAQAALDGLGERLYAVSDSPFEFKLRIVDARFPNAFALPGGWIVVTDELIDEMESPDELAGVLAHEAAHVARRHVMAAQLREMGFSILLEFLIGGGSGAGQEIARTGATLESLRHSRSAEAEADEYALAYLEAADLNPAALADFFDRMQVVFEELEEEVEEAEAEAAEDADTTPRAQGQADRAEAWLNSVLRTHPDTTQRARDARQAAAGLTWSGAPALSETEWAALNAVCDTGVTQNDTAMERAAEAIADALNREQEAEEEGAEPSPDSAGTPPDMQD